MSEMSNFFDQEFEEFMFASPGGSLDPGGTDRSSDSASDDDSDDDSDDGTPKGGGSLDPGGTG